MRSRKALVLTVAALTAVAGCTLNRSSLRKGTESFLGQIGQNVQVIEPKRTLLSVTILPRPVDDKLINETLWAGADEQVVPSETRRALEANGLRIGLLTGGVPADVEAALHPSLPEKAIEPSEFNLPDGSQTLVTLAEMTPSTSLLLNGDGRAFGKDYKDASGWLRVTASHEGPTDVALRFVPEIHHGPMQRRYDSLPNATGTPNAMQFMLKDGQQEDSLRDLATNLTLQPGQVAVIGCDPTRKGSLGAYLFTQAEANSDRLVQKVLLVRASRTNVGIPGSQPDAKPNLVPEDPPDDLAVPARKGEADARPPAAVEARQGPAAEPDDDTNAPPRDDAVTRAALAPRTPRR